MRKRETGLLRYATLRSDMPKKHDPLPPRWTAKINDLDVEVLMNQNGTAEITVDGKHAVYQLCTDCSVRPVLGRLPEIEGDSLRGLLECMFYSIKRHNADV